MMEVDLNGLSIGNTQNIQTLETLETFKTLKILRVGVLKEVDYWIYME